jgi:hypothetical protein
MASKKEEPMTLEEKLEQLINIRKNYDVAIERLKKQIEEKI